MAHGVSLLIPNPVMLALEINHHSQLELSLRLLTASPYALVQIPCKQGLTAQAFGSSLLSNFPSTLGLCEILSAVDLFV